MPHFEKVKVVIKCPWCSHWGLGKLRKKHNDNDQLKQTPRCSSSCDNNRQTLVLFVGILEHNLPSQIEAKCKKTTSTELFPTRNPATWKKNWTYQTYLSTTPTSIQTILHLYFFIGSLYESFVSKQHQPNRRSLKEITRSRFNFMSLTKYRSRKAFSLRNTGRATSVVTLGVCSWSNSQASSKVPLEPRGGC